ncbi:MAG: hypothetical protein Kow0069_18360 [Promethearchaeota archaeon]
MTRKGFFPPARLVPVFNDPSGGEGADDAYDHSVKADLVPVVAALLGCPPEPLAALSVDLLQTIYERVSSGFWIPETIAHVVTTTRDPGHVAAKLAKLTTPAGPASSGAEPYDEAADLRAGIAALFPDPQTSAKVAAALADVDDPALLANVAAMPPTQVLEHLGLVAPAPPPGHVTPTGSYPMGDSLKKVNVKRAIWSGAVPAGGKKEKPPKSKAFWAAVAAVSVVGILVLVYLLAQFVLTSWVRDLANPAG